MPPRLVPNNFLELFRQEGRSEGHHVSAALHAVMASLHPERFAEDRALPQTRMDLGNALENAISDALAKLHPDRYARPGQLELDDVFGTPDLWDLHRWRTVEIKLTWASSRRAEDIEDPWFWRYWAQLKAYCHMAGQTGGDLIICFINGNYRRDDPEGSQPTIITWEDDWSPQELSEAWHTIKVNARPDARRIERPQRRIASSRGRR